MTSHGWYGGGPLPTIGSRPDGGVTDGESAVRLSARGTTTLAVCAGLMVEQSRLAPSGYSPARSRAHGSANWTVSPRSGLRVAQSRPPWDSMMVEQIARPIPSPSALVV